MARAAGDKVIQMKRAFKIIGVVCGILFFLAVCDIVFEKITYSRAKPPENVTDIASCLIWLKQPMSARRITTDKTVYYQIIGPAGYYAASGPSAYSFDSQGRFIGWTPD